MYYQKLLNTVVFLTFVLCSCTPRPYRVSWPNFTILKQHSESVGDFLGNPNGVDGHYIILHNSLKTYVSHKKTSEEIGTWQMIGDTLLLTPQLSTSLYDSIPGKYIKYSGKEAQFKYLITNKFAYDITEYIIDYPDSLYKDCVFRSQVDSFNHWRENNREEMLILYNQPNRQDHL